MAAVPPPRDRDNASYNDGGGQGYGKFRKQPYRRTRATPYDRPPTVVRNAAGGGLQGQGWLSKLVDPAQRLITSGAYRLFGSVFRKRLPPPPPPQPPEQPELGRGDADEQPPESFAAQGLLGKRAEADNGCDNRSSGSDGVSHLETILKQKTFTRSEIDHLTTILLSRMPDGDEEKRPELTHSRAIVPQERKEFPSTPFREVGVDRNLLSAPSHSRVLDEDVASPAELAKAFMVSRPSMGSPSKQGFHNQSLRENSTALITHPFSAKSPMPSHVTSSSGRAGFAENGFVTPRSRGRTAIYSMARTPYARVQPASSLQISGAVIDTFGEQPSSSQNLWEKNRFSGSKQGALKRRFSVLDSDIGSVGPIRRIRQKSNLLPSSKTLSSREAGVASDAVERPSIEKPVSAGEASRGNRDKDIHGSGFNPVSSKSREVASKILQQLDVLVSSREKSPAKLSPSMLSGPALKSLENVDSSKFLENLDVNQGNILPNARDKQPQKLDKIEENGLIKAIASYDKSTPSINSLDSTNLAKKDVPSLKPTPGPVTDGVPQSSLQRKRGFQMSAHEDFLELDYDDNPKGTLPATFSGRTEKLETISAENGTSAVDAVGVQKLPASTDSVVTESSNGLAAPAIPPPAVTVQQAVEESRSTLFSDKAVLPGKPGAALSPLEKVVPAKSQHSVSSIPNSISATGMESGGDLPDSKQGGLSSTPIITGKNDSVEEDTELQKVDGKNNIKSDFFGRPPEPLSAVPTPSTSSIFSFGVAASSTLSNGSITSTPIFSSSLPIHSNNIHQNSSNNSSGTLASSISDAVAVSSAPSNGSNGSLGISAPAPLFKFGSSMVPPTSVSSGPESNVIKSVEEKTRKASFPNLSNAHFGGTSSAMTSIGGTSSAITSTGGNMFGGTSAGASTSDAFAITSSGANNFGSSSVNSSTGFGGFSYAPSAVTSSGSGTIGGMPSVIAGATLSGSAAVMSSENNNVSSASMAANSSPTANFGFTSGAASTTTIQSQGVNPFVASSAHTGFGASTQSMPLQFSSSASTPSSSIAGNTNLSVGSSVPSSSTSAATLFNSGAFGLTSSSSTSNSISSSSSMTTSIFGSSWQGTKSSPLAGPTSSSSSSSPSFFTFGAPSTANSAAISTPGVFGSSIGTSTSASLFSVASNTSSASPFPSFNTTSSASPFTSLNTTSSASPFSFSSPAISTQPQSISTQPQSVFGNPSSNFAFGSTPSSSTEQMTMEDSMAEDTMQASSPPVPVFGQQPPSAGFTFGSTAPPAGNPFGAATPPGNQFGAATPPGPSPFQFATGQQTPVASQSTSLFQSGSLNGGGGSFSLGTGGEDKSQRRIIRAKRPGRKK
ncbi:hypothetical protein Tsubulata_017748 [Turnera subulata]|uniref:Nuclear pore complex protein NUP1 n=1 Tax=Turnera subulata TaxID=218843 RepID=A0A9Q0GHB2_9ROSI|nr:hypothetical protein Tsubulata_017748 [Turnera subulata]